jgi:hypothetical protein
MATKLIRCCYPIRQFDAVRESPNRRDRERESAIGKQQTGRRVDPIRVLGVVVQNL